ncbi:RidA family protein [Ruegeria sp.]|uniref:RidA family protein n=1 Tax=Ruegeria sp. TaxID=1879320 RepID=UPI003C7A8CB2
MPRKNYNPQNFELDVDHPWTMAIQTNDMVVLNPQLDLDHPDDLDSQTTVSIEHIRKLMSDIDCKMSDITNLRVSYVNTGDVDEDVYRQSIIDQMPDLDAATIEMVPFDRLVLPELLVEICTYAMTGPGARSKSAPEGLHHPGGALSQGVKRGDMIFVGQQVARDAGGTVLNAGDIKAQAATTVDRLEQVLNELGADLADVVRLNIFYDAATSDADWDACMQLLKQRFGAEAAPSLTAIPLPRLFPAGTQIMVSAWAMRGRDGARLEKTYVGLDDAHNTPGPVFWRHAVGCGDMVFAGGQSTVQADGSVGATGDHIAQTKQTMANIDALMAPFGEKLQNVHKTNSYYVLNTVQEFNDNLQTRTDCFVKPGPGSVGLPLDTLTHKGQRIEVEAILVKQ